MEILLIMNRIKEINNQKKMRKIINDLMLKNK